MKKVYIFLGLCIAGITAYYVSSKQQQVDYSTQIKPILNKNCISCHGGVKKQGGFSLLFQEEALGKTKSGKPAIVPGHPEPLSSDCIVVTRKKRCLIKDRLFQLRKLIY
jgi:hypothetical protein